MQRGGGAGKKRLRGQSPGGPGYGGMKPPPSGAEAFKYGLGPGTPGAALGSLREGRALRDSGLSRAPVQRLRRRGPGKVLSEGSG